MVKKTRRIITTCLIAALFLLIPGCSRLVGVEFTKAESRQIIHKAATLTLAWDPSLSDIHNSPNEVELYRVYYRPHGTSDWQLIDEVAAEKQPQFTIKHEDLGNGLFDFAIEAVTVNDSTSPMHTSLDRSADPISGWHVFWINSRQLKEQ